MNIEDAENVRNFKYYDSIINNNKDCTASIRRRLNMIIQNLTRFKRPRYDTNKKIKARIKNIKGMYLSRRKIWWGGVKGQAGVQWTISKPIKKKANPELIFQ